MRDPFSMDALLENLQSLPTLPEVAMKVLQKTSDPDAGIKDLEELMSNDPSLTAKVLRVANSSYYGLSRQVSTLKMALVVLGLEETARIIRAITFLNAFPSIRVGGQFDYSSFWLHCITVAEVVRGLATRLKIREYSESLTGALLHDMGHLVLASFFEEDFVDMVTLADEKQLSWLDAEQEVLGFDHPRIGAILCKRWNLPETIHHVVRYHHAPIEAEKHFPSVYLGYLANRITAHYGVYVARETNSTTLAADPVWEGLSRYIPHTPFKPEDLIAASKQEIELGAELHQQLLQ
ncbi:HDOD domain-containing protein [bacterium]|nr:HDOD domain-containing protein [bacterium]